MGSIARDAVRIVRRVIDFTTHKCSFSLEPGQQPRCLCTEVGERECLLCIDKHTLKCMLNDAFFLFI